MGTSAPARLHPQQGRLPQAAAPHRGAGPRAAADGRGGEVLHRHPHPGLRDDQGAAGGRARPARRAPGALRRRRRPRGRPRGRGRSSRRPPTPSPASSGPDAPTTRKSSHEPDQHLHRHRHDLRPLRRLGHRGGPGDRRRRATSTSTSRPAPSPSPATEPLDDAAVRAAVEEAGYQLAMSTATAQGRRLPRRPGRRLRGSRSASAGLVGPSPSAAPGPTPPTRARRGDHDAATHAASDEHCPAG